MNLGDYSKGAAIYMAGTQAELEVLEVAERGVLNEVALSGHVRKGIARAGMGIKIWVDGGLYMKATIKAVAYSESQKDNGLAELTLDMPEPKVRELWLGLCRPGDVLTIESEV